MFYMDMENNFEANSAKRPYEPLSVSPLQVESSQPLLVGSKSAKPIKVATVTVEDYTQGFGDPTVPGTDFQDVSFD